MRAFIVRPFGTKDGIDFDAVERVLIAPALREVGAEGGTTIDIVESGNIRVDMFRRLLTADLVVADLSIHNANVFYELGIRHALREHGTFMMRCSADRFPFDLQTDRYFVYQREDPAASLPALVAALARTKDASGQNAAARDSPVFMSLPSLREPDPTQFMAVPQDFGEDVRLASEGRRAGDLALLSHEVDGFEWELKGWRTIGRAQFDLKAYPGAKQTWEKVRRLEPDDLEANIRLGTVYERLGDPARSTRALERALANEGIRREERAETFSLLARNAKARWHDEWQAAPEAERPAAALRSQHVRDAFENYARAFDEDLNHFYSGLNALAMLSVTNELAAARPDVWNELYESDEEAEAALASRRSQAARLAGAVEVSLEATRARLKREGREDVWAEVSAADLRLLTGASPRRVSAAYRHALTAAPEFAAEAVRKQLALYRELGVLGAALPEVFKVVGEPSPAQAAAARPRVLLFTGHMIDAPGRESPRFPADGEQAAREKLREVVVKEMQSGAGVAAGYAGGASGGDLLFHEVCAELGIPTRLYLAFPPQPYVRSSVQKAGPQWVERFWKLYNARAAEKNVRVLSEAVEVGDASERLPAWLRAKPGYGIWERTNLWLLFNALDEGCDPRGDDPNLTLIALWDGSPGDGPGGTEDLVERVENLGARREIIYTKELFGL